MDKSALTELLHFLTSSTRKDVKSATVKTVTQLSACKEGLDSILTKGKEFIGALLTYINEQDENILENILKALVNISAEEKGCKMILYLDNDIIIKLKEFICNPEYCHADLACGILVNLSHPRDQCSQVFIQIEKNSAQNFEDLFKAFCLTKYNNKGASLDLIGSLIANFTQIEAGRKLLLQKKSSLFERLIPFIEYPDSCSRRKSVVSAIHNCCFEKDFHEWMLSEEIDLASRLVLPLAGPDSLTTEENESLPLDLQYLPDDKTREKNPELRALLLESLMQLCTTRKAREILRDSNIYLILREHHKWEQNETCIELNEDVVNFFIRTEEEIGHEDLSKVEVPEDLIEKFSKPPLQHINA